MPVYSSRLFDEETLAYVLDLYDVAELEKVRRDKCVEDGDTNGAEKHEAKRNEHISKLKELLAGLRK